MLSPMEIDDTKVEQFMESVGWLFEREPWEHRCAEALMAAGFEGIKVHNRILEHHITVFRGSSSIALEARNKAPLIRRILKTLAAEGFEVGEDMVTVRATVWRTVELTVGVLTPLEFCGPEGATVLDDPP